MQPTSVAYPWLMDVPESITCVECSGTAHRMGHPPPDVGFSPGDAVTFVCVDCGNRHDIVVEDDQDDRDDYEPGRVL